MWRPAWLKFVIVPISAAVLGLLLIAGQPGDLAAFIALILALTFFYAAIALLRRARARQRIAGQILEHLEQAILLNLPLPRAMAALADDHRGGPRSTSRAIPIDLANGLPLATVLERHTALPRHTIRTIATAEACGQLDRVVPALAAARRKVVERRVRSGDFYRHYPLLVIIVLLGVVELMRVFTGPKFAQIFHDFRQPLPWITQVTISFGGDNGDLLVFLLLVSFIIFWIWGLVPSDRADSIIPSRLALRIESIFSRSRRDESLAGAFGFIADAMEDQRDLPASLQMAADLSSNSSTRIALLNWRSELARGVAINQAARNAKLPEMFTELIGVESRTSDLTPALRFAGEYYRVRSEQLQAWFNLAIAPTAALSLGFCVAWVALSVMLPMVRLIDVTNARALVVR